MNGLRLHSTVVVIQVLYNGPQFTHTPLPKGTTADLDDLGFEPPTSRLSAPRLEPQSKEGRGPCQHAPSNWIKLGERLQHLQQNEASPSQTVRSSPRALLKWMSVTTLHPRIAWRKSKVTVVTSYGAHFNSRLACVMYLSLFPPRRSHIRQA